MVSLIGYIRRINVKYMLFAWDDHDAGGGMRDFIGLYGTIDKAEERFNVGYIPLYALELPSYQQERHVKQYDRGMIVNATSLKVEKDL